MTTPIPDRIVRKIHDLSQAYHEIRRTFGDELGNEVVIEHYPSRTRSYDGQAVAAGVFAYQFFNRDGKNCGYYLVDMDTVMVLGRPRDWLLPKPHTMNVQGLADRYN